MDIKKLQATVVDALEDIKAQDIVLFDTTKLTSLFDRMVIASGGSNRQTKALAASVRDKVKQAGGTVVGIEGEDAGEWVLVDLGDIVVHIMQPAIRAYYQLEEIWGGKPIPLGAAKRTAKKAPASPKTRPAAKPAAKKTATKAAPKKATPENAASAGKKAVARKTVAGKKTSTAAKPKAAAKKTAARKTGE